MEDEVEVIEKPVDDIGADILAAMEEVSEPAEVEKAEEPEAAPEPVKEVPQAPQSWTAEAKAEWANAPDKIRAEVLKREQDMHQALTRHDGELRLGRDMKEIITPYMPFIQAAGSTPASTMGNLLNTAYKLTTGDDATRVSIFKQIAKDYKIKVEDLIEDQEYVDPMLASLRQEIEQLKQIANPQAVESRLRERMESDKVQSDIKAFASNPANAHFKTLEPLIKGIIDSGQIPFKTPEGFEKTNAEVLKEAYDMACYASPQIRSTLEAAKQAEVEAKRKQEVAQKKRAASSITGSPAVPSNSRVTNPKTSVEDDLRAAFDELESKI